MTAAEALRIAAVRDVASLLEHKLSAGRLPEVLHRPADPLGGLSFAEAIAAEQEAEVLALVKASFDWATPAYRGTWPPATRFEAEGR